MSTVPYLQLNGTESQAPQFDTPKMKNEFTSLKLLDRNVILCFMPKEANDKWSTKALHEFVQSNCSINLFNGKWLIKITLRRTAPGIRKAVGQDQCNVTKIYTTQSKTHITEHETFHRTKRSPLEQIIPLDWNVRRQFCRIHGNGMFKVNCMCLGLNSKTPGRFQSQ